MPLLLAGAGRWLSVGLKPTDRTDRTDSCRCLSVRRYTDTTDKSDTWDRLRLEGVTLRMRRDHSVMSVKSVTNGTGSIGRNGR